MIFQLRSYSGGLDESTGVLGNICGLVLCYVRKGQAEKNGGHLPHTLHLKLVMLAVLGLAALSFLSFRLTPQISLKWQRSIIHYKLSIRALAFVLLLY